MAPRDPLGQRQQRRAAKARHLRQQTLLFRRSDGGWFENLIKAHKLHLASDRTSCTKATANQFRLLIHTAAYWLLHGLRGLAPKHSFWREAQFDSTHSAKTPTDVGQRW